LTIVTQTRIPFQLWNICLSFEWGWRLKSHLTMQHCV